MINAAFYQKLIHGDGGQELDQFGLPWAERSSYAGRLFHRCPPAGLVTS
jgi:hypothetical protein